MFGEKISEIFGEKVSPNAILKCIFGKLYMGVEGWQLCSVAGWGIYGVEFSGSAARVSDVQNVSRNSWRLEGET